MYDINKQSTDIDTGPTLELYYVIRSHSGGFIVLKQCTHKEVFITQTHLAITLFIYNKIPTFLRKKKKHNSQLPKFHIFMVHLCLSLLLYLLCLRTIHLLWSEPTFLHTPNTSFLSSHPLFYFLFHPPY